MSEEWIQQQLAKAPKLSEEDIKRLTLLLNPPKREGEERSGLGDSWIMYS